MAKTIHNLTVKIGGDSKALRRELAKSKKGVNGFGSQLKKMGAQLAGAFAVGAIVQQTVKMSKLDAVAQGVEAAFSKINDANLLNELTKATKGTLSEFELMQAAVKFDNFNLPLNELGDLLKFVQLRANQTGDSMDYLSTSLVEGLSKESKLRIDNLGISLSKMNSELKKGISFTEAVANIAREELTKAGDVVDTTSEKYARLAANISNRSGEIGSIINKTFMNDVLDSFNAVLSPAKSVTDAMINQNTEANLLAIRLTQTNLTEAERVKILEELKAISPDIVKGLSAENIEVEKLKDNLRLYNQEFVKKLAIQKSEETVAAKRDEMAAAVQERVASELELQRQLYDIGEKISQKGEKYAKQVDDILLSKDDEVTKAEKLLALAQDEANFRSAFAQKISSVSQASQKLVDNRQEENDLQTELNKEIATYEDTYKRIYGLAEKKPDSNTTTETNAIKEQIPILQAAEEKLKELTDARDAAITPDQLAKYNRLIELQKAEIENLNKLGTGTARTGGSMAPMASKSIQSIPIQPGPSIDLKRETVDVKALQTELQNLILLRNALVSLPTADFEVAPEGEVERIEELNVKIQQLEAKLKVFGVTAEEVSVTTGESFKEMSINISGAMGSMAVGLSEGLADLATGNATIGDFFNNVLGLISDFMTSLGQQLIAVGVASEAFQMAFDNPYVAIAAGAALIITAGIVRNTMEQGPGLIEGGVVPSGYPNDGYNARLTSGEIVAPPQKLETFFAQMLNKMSPANYGMSDNVSGLKVDAIPVDVRVSGQFRQSGTDMVATINMVNTQKMRLKGY